MSRKYKKIAPGTQNQLLLGAAVIATNFDPEQGALADEDILGSTTGGVRVNIVPKYVDHGSDIDNCPKNTKELKDVEDWSINASGTFVTISPETSKMLVAAADGGENNKLTPRMSLKDEDFSELWVIGSYSASEDAFIAINLRNALNVDGFTIQTGDRAKGQFAFNFAAHFSLEDPDEVPFDIYLSEATA